MHDIRTPAYQKALNRSLCRSTFIVPNQKEQEPQRSRERQRQEGQEHPTPYYIWHTAGDGKVRPEHAANEGKIFAWDSPPSTGNPGEAYGCRRTAEPYYGILDKPIILTSEAHQKRRLLVINALRAMVANAAFWEDEHFAAHFFVGNGEAVTLQEIGHLAAFKEFYYDWWFVKFEQQLKRKAEFLPDGYFTDNFDTTYDFQNFIYSYGGGRMKGYFYGQVETISFYQKKIIGSLRFEFSDVFTDPLKIIEWIVDPIMDLIDFRNRPEILDTLADIGGSKYPLTGGWEESYSTIFTYDG